MMKAAIALVMSTMLTVDQRDSHRSDLDAAWSAVSSDGRYVAFITYAQLAGADTDDMRDVYVLDRVEQQVFFETTGAGDANPTDCSHPALSADGRYLVYESDGAIVWRDRRESVTRVVGRGRQPSITADGRVILFVSGQNIYSVEPHSDAPRRVSIDMPELDAATAASFSPSSSADGQHVAFSARPPAPGRHRPMSQVFVRDTGLNVTRRIGSGWAPAMSGDGRYVAFAGPSSGLTHIFLADLHKGTTQLITKSARRGKANGDSANPSVSSNGRFIVFQSKASDLVPGEDFNLLWDVFVYDRESGTIARVSGDLDGVWMEPSIGPSIDGSGGVIAFSSRHPTASSDKRNDFDLYVATIARNTRD